MLLNREEVAMAAIRGLNLTVGDIGTACSITGRLDMENMLNAVQNLPTDNSDYIMEVYRKCTQLVERVGSLS